MKIKIIIVLSICVFTQLHLNAQNRLYVGFELAKINDQYILSNPNSNIGAPVNFNRYVPYTSLILGYEINQWLSFETGLTSKPFKQGYSIDYRGSGGGVSSGYSSDVYLQVPLRLSSNINIYKKFYLNAAVGYHFGFSNDAIQTEEQQTGNGGIRSSGGLEASHSSSVQIFNNRYGLIETGLGLTYRMNDRISFYARVASYKGLDTIDQVNVTYEDNQGNNSSNSIINMGSYNSLGFGMNFRFNSFTK